MAINFSLRKITRALLYRNFALFALGSSITLIGTWMHRIGVGWLTWELTHSTTWLGLVGFADLVPAVVIAPFSGVAADRWDRHRMMKLTQFLAAVLAGLLALLYFIDLANIWTVLAFTLALGSVDAFAQPFRMAFISAIIPRSELATAVAIKSITFNLARFVGPALAGFVIVWSSAGWVFVLNAVSSILFLVTLSLMDVEPWSAPSAPVKSAILRQAAAGAALAFANPGIAAVLILLGITCFAARPIVEMLPAWASEIFSGNAGDLAALTSAVGIGAIAGGLWLAGRHSPVGLMRVFLACCIGLGLSLPAFALSPHVLVGLSLVAVVGFFMVASSTCAQTMVQLSVADNERGRVLSVYAVILRGSPALGAVTMGTAAQMFGLRWPLVAGGVLILAGSIIACLKASKLQSMVEAKLERLDVDP